jgi:glutamyl-tRNA reductase
MLTGVHEPPLLIAGISHKRLGLDAFSRAKTEGLSAVGQSLLEIKRRFALREVALVNTCNRFELVASAAHGHEAGLDALREALPSEQSYFCDGAEAVRHFYRVLASLDSLIVGESQIVSQVKQSYLEAVQYKTSGPYLHRLFQTGFHCSKQVRTHTALSLGSVSVVSVGVQLLQQVLGDLKDKRVLLLGAGETAELCVQHLYSIGCRDIVIANRSIERASELASLYGAAGIELEAAYQYIPRVDLVISAMQLESPWLTAERFKTLAYKQTLCLLDLGMPMNLDPIIGEQDGVYLFSLNDLQRLADQNRNNRLLAAKEAEVIVDAQVLNYLKWARRFEMRTQISKMQQRAQLLADRIAAQQANVAGLGAYGSERERVSAKIFHEFLKLKKVV